VAECPRCERKANRVIHSVPVIFKGSGFYVTDHRKDGGNGDSGVSKKESPVRKEKTEEKDAVK